MNSNDNSNKKTKKAKHKNPFRYFIYDFIKWSRALSVLIWQRPLSLYESQTAKKHVKNGAVVIANHVHIFDPIALLCTFWYRRLHFLIQQESFEKPFPRWFFTHVGGVPVDRENFNMNTYRAAIDLLQEGKLLCIFPEGHINFDDPSTIKAFKSGSVLMAIKAGVPIVPTYLVPRKKWYSRAITVIGEPIDINKLCGGQSSIRAIEEITKILQEKELKLKEVYESWKKTKSSK